jgi:DNA polymerase (family 10)
VATNNPEIVIERFVSFPKIQKVIEKGPKTSSILLPGNVQVDILVTEPKAFGNALQHFTGSKNHNIALREFSLKKGFSMNEFRILNKKTNKPSYFDNEKDLYNFLGLEFITPELREGVGEIQSSLTNKLPEILKLEDIKADLQIHSSFDIETSHDLGINSMEDIVKRAGELNYEYLAFTEHNPSKKGHDEKQIEDILKRKKEKVDELNYSRESSAPFVFNSLEIDMGKDGSLPVSVKGLETLDFALVSIHSSFDLPRSAMTERVLNALSHPKVKIFAHPTGRKINEREGVELDWEKVFDFCLQNNKWVEINSDPMRLDLPDTLVRDAVKLGIKLTMGTDTHSIDMMDNMKYGVNVARRGWAEKKDIVNTRSLKDFREMLQS